MSDPGPVPAGDGANPDGAAVEAAQRFDLVWRDGMLTVGQDSEPASSLLIADIRLAQKSPLIRATPWGPMPDGSYRATARVRDEVIRDLVARHDEDPQQSMADAVAHLQLDDDVRYDPRPARASAQTTCIVCGASVVDGWQQAHADWHARLLRALVNVDERVQALEGHPRR